MPFSEMVLYEHTLTSGSLQAAIQQRYPNFGYSNKDVIFTHENYVDPYTKKFRESSLFKDKQNQYGYHREIQHACYDPFSAALNFVPSETSLKGSRYLVIDSIHLWVSNLIWAQNVLFDSDLTDPLVNRASQQHIQQNIFTDLFRFFQQNEEALKKRDIFFPERDGGDVDIPLILVTTNIDFDIFKKSELGQFYQKILFSVNNILRKNVQASYVVFNGQPILVCASSGFMSV
jgi:adenosyl cobinamide kinase/adenosyl cobinamide phosphate guanylyltransferase